MISDVILDIQALREITDGDRDLERGLVRLYCSTAERCLVRLRGLANTDEKQEWKYAVHEFMGASANIHANQIAALCKYAEHEDDPAMRLQVCDNLDRAYETLKAFCSSLIQ
jgi:HPt (histidine-containing phosphotransfer) domain-containing protein